MVELLAPPCILHVRQMPLFLASPQPQPALRLLPSPAHNGIRMQPVLRCPPGRQPARGFTSQQGNPALCLPFGSPALEMAAGTVGLNGGPGDHSDQWGDQGK